MPSRITIVITDSGHAVFHDLAEAAHFAHDRSARRQ